MLDGKSILLIISGGIAAYKSLELIRRLRERGAAVRCVLTAGGAQFVTPLSVAALSAEKVYQDLFSLTDESEMGHIRLSREADLIVVAPASADLMARMAAGMTDDLAATVLLATDKPVLVAPTMNTRMWEHPATRRNMARLKDDGVLFVDSPDGDLACGEVGKGRMAEPMAIIEAIEAFFQAGRPEGAKRPLAGLHALVTSGPTHEPIDPVRYIANRSSGKQGHAIAAACAHLGARVTLVSGPTAQADPSGVLVVRVETARDMLAACEAALPADVAICAAAVADWRVAHQAAAKLKKGAAGMPVLEMAENPDILATLAARNDRRPRLVIGFAAETHDVVAYAQGKLVSKGCDWIVANDVSTGTGTFGGDDNTVALVTPDMVETWPRMSKAEVAARLAQRIAERLAA
jgi:phosphopantothenoylcysteine decarboxylase/phosphopantothenate--cysteine ligase